jgi:NADPH:quinone reductase-like Zn-dependent oxidoreductase
MERAARIHQYGAPEVLAVEPVEVTAPGAGEVRIRHKAIGLNFVDERARWAFASSVPSPMRARQR